MAYFQLTVSVDWLIGFQFHLIHLCISFTPVLCCGFRVYIWNGVLWLFPFCSFCSQLLGWCESSVQGWSAHRDYRALRLSSAPQGYFVVLSDLMLVFLFLFLFLWRMSFSILIGVILNWSDYLRQYRLLYNNVHWANPCPWDHVLPSWDVSSNLFYHCFLTSFLSVSWCCLCLSPLLFVSVMDGVFFSFLQICCHYIEMTLEFWSDCLLLFLR